MHSTDAGQISRSQRASNSEEHGTARTAFLVGNGCAAGRWHRWTLKIQGHVVAGVEARRFPTARTGGRNCGGRGAGETLIALWPVGGQASESLTQGTPLSAPCHPCHARSMREAAAADGPHAASNPGLLAPWGAARIGSWRRRRAARRNVDRSRRGRWRAGLEG